MHDASLPKPQACAADRDYFRHVGQFLDENHPEVPRTVDIVQAKGRNGAPMYQLRIRGRDSAEAEEDFELFGQFLLDGGKVEVMDTARKVEEWMGGKENHAVFDFSPKTKKPATRALKATFSEQHSKLKFHVDGNSGGENWARYTLTGQISGRF